jgi:hypothetical protein
MDLFFAEARIRFYCASGRHELGRALGSEPDMFPDVGKSERGWGDGQGNVVVGPDLWVVNPDSEQSAPTLIEGRCRACRRAGVSKATPQRKWVKVVEQLNAMRAVGEQDTRVNMDW